MGMTPEQQQAMCDYFDSPAYKAKKAQAQAYKRDEYHERERAREIARMRKRAERMQQGTRRATMKPAKKAPYVPAPAGVYDPPEGVVLSMRGPGTV